MELSVRIHYTTEKKTQLSLLHKLSLGVLWACYNRYELPFSIEIQHLTESYFITRLSLNLQWLINQLINKVID